MKLSDSAIFRAPGAGLMFHHFHGGEHPVGQGSISAEEFSDLIEAVGRDNILDAHDWQFRAEAGTLRPGDLCITFDDGLACQYDIALPVLEAFDIRAFWFVYTSPLDGAIQRLEVYRHFRNIVYQDIELFYKDFQREVESSSYRALVREKMKDFCCRDYLQDFPFYTDGDRWFRYLRDQVLGPKAYFDVMDKMVLRVGGEIGCLSSKLFLSADALRDLHSHGHVIGLHSHTHPTRLGEMPRAAQSDEYSTNKIRLESLLGDPVKVMSHPCNSYGQDTLSLLGEMGLGLGFRSNMAELPVRGRFEFPREDHANLLRMVRS